MKNLLKFEFRKVFRSKYLYILAAAAIGYVLITGLTYVAIAFIMKLADAEEGIIIDPSFYDYNSYQYTKAAITGTFMTIIGIFIAIFACEDNGHGTSKNIIGKGYTRLQVYFSKYLASLIIAFSICLLGVITAAVFGLVAWGPDSFKEVDEKLALVIIGELLCIIVYHALFFAIAHSIGRSGPAIVINILAPTGITLVLAIFTVLVNKEDFSFADYWLDGIMSNFAGSMRDNLLVSNFILLFVYFAAGFVPGLLIARRKQY